MAYKLEDLTNVIAPSGSFTKGRIRDDDGSRNGTPVNEQLLGDMTQFFAKLMAEANITPNGNADDQTTNQIYDALINTPRIWEGFETAAQGAASYDATNNAWILNMGKNVIEYGSDPRSNSDPIASMQKQINSPNGTSYTIINSSQQSWVNVFELNNPNYSKPIIKADSITESSPIDWPGGRAIRLTDMVTFWLFEIM